MGLYGGQNIQSALETPEVVIDNVILNHTDQLIPAGKASAIVPFSFQNAPKALHGAVVSTLSYPRHTLGDTNCSQLVMEDLSGIGEALPRSLWSRGWTPGLAFRA